MPANRCFTCAPQLAAIKGLIGEVRLGLRQINTEVVQVRQRWGGRTFSIAVAAEAGRAQPVGGYVPHRPCWLPNFLSKLRYRQPIVHHNCH